MSNSPDQSPTKDSNAWLDAILTDDFNPWFPGSEYGKDTLEEAKSLIAKHIEEVEERTLADCAEHCDKRVAEARVEELEKFSYMSGKIRSTTCPLGSNCDGPNCKYRHEKWLSKEGRKQIRGHIKELIKLERKPQP